MNLDRPLIVQSDFSVLLEVEHPAYAEARDRLARFAELVKAPEHIHTFRISPLSVWNACAAGLTAAAAAFHQDGSDQGGSGVVVLPCGAGKTIVGMLAMTALQTSTLILTTSTSAVRQWRAELLERTTLGEDLIGEYTGSKKLVAPVTLSTYECSGGDRRRILV